MSDDVQLPEVTDVVRVRVGPGDVVVVRVPHRLTLEQIDRMHGVLRNVWPGNRVLVLDAGASIEVTTPA